MDIQNRIVSAIDCIKRVDPQYWASTLAQRLPDGAGSLILGPATPEQLEQALRTARWEPYPHPSVTGDCVAFKTNDLRGCLGIVELAVLPPYRTIVLDDRKNTGQAFCTVRQGLGKDVDFTVIILGPDAAGEIVYTFHPGEPIEMPVTSVGPEHHGREITAEEALSLGFSFAKIVT